MNYIIYFRTSRSVCPKCGGMLALVKSDDIVLNCIDCNSFFVAEDKGQAEAELTFREAELKQP